MRRLLILLFLAPIILHAQDDPPELVFQNVVISPKSGEGDAFEAALTAHNKAFHATAEHGARVYNIISGSDIGKYIWVMGPTPWAALDNRPSGDDHEDDWDKVTMHMTNEGHGSYWTFDAKNSHFPADFTISKLNVMYVDVKRNSGREVSYLLGKIREVYAEKMPDQTYGIYWNQTSSTKEGRDLAVIWFFDKWAWMGEDLGFREKFAEVFGEGSWERWLDDWVEATEGTETQLWNFRADLSGLPGDVEVAERQ